MKVRHRKALKKIIMIRNDSIITISVSKLNDSKINAHAVQNPHHKCDLGNNLRMIQSLTRK